MEWERSEGSQTEEQFMELALEEARKCLEIDEVPVGAVVVQYGKVVGRGYNRRETDRSPLAHAEILAIQDAARNLGGWRLVDCELYVTLEPCPMCAGAILQSRIVRLIYGASDPKGGACGSKLDLLGDYTWNHKTEILSGVLAEPCGTILTEYFRKKREQVKK